MIALPLHHTVLVIILVGRDFISGRQICPFLPPNRAGGRTEHVHAPYEDDDRLNALVAELTGVLHGHLLTTAMMWTGTRACLQPPPHHIMDALPHAAIRK